MWFGMSQGEDVCCSEMTGRCYTKKKLLFGFDLKEAIVNPKVVLRGLPLTASIRSWQPLVHVQPTQVVFCRNVGPIIACQSLTTHRTTPEHPKGALSCLLDDFRKFFGENWDKHLSPPSRGLPIGDRYEWIPSSFHQHSEDHDNNMCSHNLQCITTLQAKTIKKGIVGRPFKLPSGPVLITFGYACPQ
jgi:hypothetical protein